MQFLVGVLGEKPVLLKQVAEHAVEDFSLPFDGGILKSLEHLQHLDEKAVQKNESLSESTDLVQELTHSGRAGGAPG